MISRSSRWIIGPATLLCLILVGCSKPSQGPVVFETPEAAVSELAALIESHDDARIEAVFGEGSLELFRSGDEEADREDIARIRDMIAEGVAFEEYDENTLIALFGDSEWPWPIPLVHEENGWRFDTASGREELLNRRIGRNELWTLTALHEVVDAQREYRVEGHDGNPPAYAQRFLSSDGNRDGLYWPTGEGEEPSPLGGLLAESDVEQAEPPEPFHGYFYRMLPARGPDAPGGERSYVDDQGLMTRGFAVVAWPAKYGNSGIMTFMTDQRGIVYQKDLGEGTDIEAQAIDSFNPDVSWVPTPDSIDDAHFSD